MISIYLPSPGYFGNIAKRLASNVPEMVQIVVTAKFAKIVCLQEFVPKSYFDLIMVYEFTI
jgi:hypothetical protein